MKIKFALHSLSIGAVIYTTWAMFYSVHVWTMLLGLGAILVSEMLQLLIDLKLDEASSK